MNKKAARMWTRKFILTLLLSTWLPMAHAQNPVKAATAESATSTVDPSLAKNIPVPPSLLSFLEWKAQRVHEAQIKLEQMNKSNQAQVWQEGKSVGEDKPSEQKLNFNVDVALQLNVQDYFSMYLKSLGPEEFKEATKKLSPDEVAELLVAYKNSTEKEKKIPLKYSKSPKDNAKSKNTEI